MTEWKKSACILCSLNCGIELEISDDEVEIISVKGDKEHPISKGYMCEKAKRLNYYQNAKDRLTSPMRRRPDGQYEKISWETAIKEVTERLKEQQSKHGGESIFFYGGVGQGNHLSAAYIKGFMKTFGMVFRSNAVAQEKQGQIWVDRHMFGRLVLSDVEHCDVALIAGKNPWQSHGIQRAREVLTDIKRSPNRKLIVIDPRKTETAKIADIHLQVKPGTDAWCLGAILASLFENNRFDHEWIRSRCQGYENIIGYLQSIDKNQFPLICGVDLALITAAAGAIADARSLSVVEDLGVQQNVNSTLNSYLKNLIVALTGNFGRKGTAFPPVPFTTIRPPTLSEHRTPVTGTQSIVDLVPTSVIADEILSDNEQRFRSMVIVSANPVLSLSNSEKMKKAMEALEFSVVIDIAMTETAKLADYVLPACSQYEKTEATFTLLEFPKNYFHLRAPIFAPLEGTLQEGEIFCRILEEASELSEEKHYKPLKKSLEKGKPRFALTLIWLVMKNRRLLFMLPMMLFRTLGTTFAKGQENAAVVWMLSHLFRLKYRKYAKRAGYKGFSGAESLFSKIQTQQTAVQFCDLGEFEEAFELISTKSKKIVLDIEPLLEQLSKLSDSLPTADDDFPYLLAAGERRAETSNMIIRNPRWDKRGRIGALRVSLEDAKKMSLSDGDNVRVETKSGSVTTFVEVSAMMQPGNISLPNGTGVSYPDDDGVLQQHGPDINQLTNEKDRDVIAGTPNYKAIPARLTKLIDTED